MKVSCRAWLSLCGAVIHFNLLLLLLSCCQSHLDSPLYYIHVKLSLKFTADLYQQHSIAFNQITLTLIILGKDQSQTALLRVYVSARVKFEIEQQFPMH